MEHSGVYSISISSSSMYPPPPFYSLLSVYISMVHFELLKARTLVAVVVIGSTLESKSIRCGRRVPSTSRQRSKIGPKGSQRRRGKYIQSHDAVTLPGELIGSVSRARSNSTSWLFGGQKEWTASDFFSTPRKLPSASDSSSALLPSAP